MEKVCNKVLVWLCAATLLFLAAISAFFSQRIGVTGFGEIANNTPIYKTNNSILLQLFVLLLVVGMFAGLRCCTWLRRRSEWQIRIFQFVMALVAGVFSYLILEGGTRTPVADQIQVYGAAQLFNEGVYLNLTKMGYLDMYPQQLGYVGYLQILLRCFGQNNIYAVQICNCIFISGIVFGICECINELTEQNHIRVAGSLFLLPLLPVYLLSSWVYGDIPGTFFVFAFFALLLKFCKRWKWYTGVAAVACLCFAVLLRKNALVMLIAAAIVLAVFWWKQRNGVVLLTLVLVVVCPLVSVEATEKYYEAKSGYEIEGGLPSVMWIAMGMLENGSTPGWFNNFSVPVYYEAEGNREAAAEAAKQEISKQFTYFAEHPAYAVSFYKRKICTQWNDPFYNANTCIAVDEGVTPKGISAFLIDHEEGVRRVLAGYQFVTYLGALLYCIRVATHKKLEENVFLVVFFGGFLFSILWEANSRYVLPYMLMLLPVAVQGWGSLRITMSVLRGRRKRLGGKA